MADFFPEMLNRYRNERVYQGVKLLEWANGLDTVLHLYIKLRRSRDVGGRMDGRTPFVAALRLDSRVTSTVWNSGDSFSSLCAAFTLCT